MTVMITNRSITDSTVGLDGNRQVQRLHSRHLRRIFNLLPWKEKDSHHF